MTDGSNFGSHLQTTFHIGGIHDLRESQATVNNFNVTLLKNILK